MWQLRRKSLFSPEASNPGTKGNIGSGAQGAATTETEIHQTNKEEAMKKALVVAAVIFLAAPLAFAGGKEIPKVPFLTDPATRNIVGEVYFFKRTPVPPPFYSSITPDEVAVALHRNDGPRNMAIVGGPIRPISQLVPHIVEIRRYNPALPSVYVMPLVSIVWDRDYDGLADYVAVPHSQGGIMGFRIFVIPAKKRPEMTDLSSFRSFGSAFLPTFFDL